MKQRPDDHVTRIKPCKVPQSHKLFSRESNTLVVFMKPDIQDPECSWT
jgi:hypothetical protein